MARRFQAAIGVIAAIIAGSTAYLIVSPAANPSLPNQPSKDASVYAPPGLQSIPANLPESNRLPADAIGPKNVAPESNTIQPSILYVHIISEYSGKEIEGMDVVAYALDAIGPIPAVLSECPSSSPCSLKGEWIRTNSSGFAVIHPIANAKAYLIRIPYRDSYYTVAVKSEMIPIQNQNTITTIEVPFDPDNPPKKEYVRYVQGYVLYVHVVSELSGKGMEGMRVGVASTNSSAIRKASELSRPSSYYVTNGSGWAVIPPEANAKYFLLSVSESGITEDFHEGFSRGASLAAIVFQTVPVPANQTAFVTIMVPAPIIYVHVVSSLSGEGLSGVQVEATPTDLTSDARFDSLIGTRAYHTNRTGWAAIYPHANASQYSLFVPWGGMHCYGCGIVTTVKLQGNQTQVVTIRLDVMN